MAKTAQALCDAGIIADGSLGVSRAVQVLPLANSTRTSASVMVFCNPSISTFWPASGSSVRMRQVCTIASPVGCETIGVTVSILPENNACQRQPRIALHGRLEQHAELVRRLFLDAEIGGAHLVGRGTFRKKQRNGCRQHDRPEIADRGATRRTSTDRSTCRLILRPRFGAGSEPSTAFAPSSSSTPYFLRSSAR